MKTILILQEKGGTGKSTIAAEIARSLQRTGIPSALYNLDAQGSYIIEPYEDTDCEIAVIDTPGVLDDRAGQWVAAADVVIVPTRCSKLDITPLLRTTEIVNRNKKSACKLYVILNQFTRWKSSVDFAEWIQTQDIGAEILTLPQSEIFLQASAAGMGVIDYRRRSEPGNKALVMVNTIRQAVGIPTE